MSLVVHWKRLVFVCLVILRFNVAVVACGEQLSWRLAFSPCTDVDATTAFGREADDPDSCEEDGDSKEDKEEMGSR